LDFRPFGGSTVIFMPFCSTLTGKCGAGIELSHSLKVGATFSGSSSSTRRSSTGMKDCARWQF
jgi:hypothetical protein